MIPAPPAWLVGQYTGTQANGERDAAPVAAPVVGPFEFKQGVWEGTLMG